MKQLVIALIITGLFLTLIVGFGAVVIFSAGKLFGWLPIDKGIGLLMLIGAVLIFFIRKKSGK